MKARLYHVLVLTVSLAATVPAVAQITITSADVGAELAFGVTTTTYIDTSTHTIDIGPLGATTWDYSGLFINSSVNSQIVRADTTPFYGNFPTATHAVKAGGGYSYLALGTDLQLLGYQSASPFPIRAKDLPAQILEHLPMTAGTGWTTAYTESSYATIGGITYPSASHEVVTYTVDAYGIMTLPGASDIAMLRVKSDRHNTTGVNTYRSITYQFLAKNGTTISVVPSDTLQPNTGTISVSSISWSLSPVGTSVEEIPGSVLPTGYALEQNYPNPFNPVTTIEFSVPERSVVGLEVYDLLGRKIATLVSQELAVGSYSVRWDAQNAPSGVYFYRLHSGTYVETKRLVLLR